MARKLFKNKTRLHYCFTPLDVEAELMLHLRMESGRVAVAGMSFRDDFPKQC